jgi:hypothetical protein
MKGRNVQGRGGGGSGGIGWRGSSPGCWLEWYSDRIRIQVVVGLDCFYGRGLSNGGGGPQARMGSKRLFNLPRMRRRLRGVNSFFSERVLGNPMEKIRRRDE